MGNSYFDGGKKNTRSFNTGFFIIRKKSIRKHIRIPKT